MNLCREEHTLSPIKCSPSVRAKPMVIISHVRSRSLSCAPECRQHNHNPSGKRIACSFLSQNPLPPLLRGGQKRHVSQNHSPPPYICVCVCVSVPAKSTLPKPKSHTHNTERRKRVANHHPSSPLPASFPTSWHTNRIIPGAKTWNFTL